MSAGMKWIGTGVKMKANRIWIFSQARKPGQKMTGGCQCCGTVSGYKETDSRGKKIIKDAKTEGN